jgi:hypothetical protein
MRQMLAVVSTSLLLLVACGGDDGGGDDGGGEEQGESGDGESSPTTGEPVDAEADEYIDALITNMTQEETAPLDEETASCVANAIVDIVGVEPLNSAGVAPGALAEAESLSDLAVEVPDDTGERLGESFGACEVGEPLTSLIVDGIAAQGDSELVTRASTCLDESMDRQALADALAASFLDGSDESFNDAVSDGFAQCPDALTASIVAQAPTEVTPDAEACVAGVVEENPDLAAAAVARNDEEASNQLADRLAQTCPQVVGG